MRMTDAASIFSRPSAPWVLGTCIAGLPLWAVAQVAAELAAQPSAEPASAASGIQAQAPAAAQVAHALGWLDPAMGVLWLLVVALGVWRFAQLRRQLLAQTALRGSLGAAAPQGPTTVPAKAWLGFSLLTAALLLGCVWAVQDGPGHASWMAMDECARQWSAVHMLAAAPALITALQWLTDSGDVLFMGIVTVAMAVWLARRKRWLDLQVWLFFSVANGLTIRVLKQLVERERPENILGLVVSGASFPSGHAAGSLLVYSLMACLLTAHWPSAKRTWAVALAVAWALAIGASRVLLAAHWTSDVVAGWLLGATGVFVALAVSRALRAD